MTPPLRLCVLCAPAFALAATTVCSCARSAVIWVRCFLSDDPVAPRSRFTVAWDYIIFGGHIVYRASPFCVSMRSYPPELQRQLTTSGPTDKGGGGGNYKPPPVCNGNGLVSTSVRLACALRYFTGGSPYDIMAKYGLSHVSVYESIWAVVEAVDTFDEFDIEYPASEIAQLKIAEEFKNVSEVKFNNCAGATNSILISI